MLVALTREAGANDDLRALVGARARVVEVPLTTTSYRGVDDVATQIAAQRAALGSSGPYRSLVVTSARVRDFLAPALEVLAEDCEVFSVGPATTRMLEERGLVVARESAHSSRELVEHIAAAPVLFLGATGGRDDLRTALEERSLRCDVVGCYETLAAPLDEASRATLGECDVVFIGAPSAWRVAREWVSGDAWMLVPGTTTAHTVLAQHAKVLVGWGDDFESAWTRILAAR